MSVLALNGEIYNARDLARELGEPWTPDVVDAHVLALWLDRYGRPGLETVAGEYSLAYLQRGHSLLLARDGFGSHPLYVSAPSAPLAFGSSARGVARLAMNAPPSLNPERVLDALWYGIVPGAPVVDGVRIVPPGTALECMPSGVRRRHTLSGPEKGYTSAGAPHPDDPTDDRHVAKTEMLLQRAVERRHDRQTALAFSGGLDSSLIRAVWPGPVFAFRLRASTPRGASDRRPTEEDPDVQEVHLTPDSLYAALDAYVERAEGPVTHLSGVGMSVLSASIRQAGFENTISGEGADESYIGYHHYLQSGAGHPTLVHRHRDRSVVESLLPGRASETTPLPFSRRLRDLLESPSPKDWLAFDRSVRLPEHLCRLNSDLPCLLAGVESRLPYLDLPVVPVSQIDALRARHESHIPASTEERPTVLKMKPMLRSIAQRLGVTVPPKSGLHVSCTALGRDNLDQLARKTQDAGTLPFLGIPALPLEPWLERVWASTEVLDEISRAYVREITARWILGLYAITVTRQTLRTPTSAGPSLPPYALHSTVRAGNHSSTPEGASTT